MSVPTVRMRLPRRESFPSRVYQRNEIPVSGYLTRDGAGTALWDHRSVPTIDHGSCPTWTQNPRCEQVDDGQQLLWDLTDNEFRGYIFPVITRVTQRMIVLVEGPADNGNTVSEEIDW